MRPRYELPESLREDAERRGGVVHLDELRTAGVSRTVLGRLRSATLTPLGSGWFGFGEPTWAGYVLAATALVGDRGVASGRTAAALHRLQPEALPIEFSCTPSGPRSREWATFARVRNETRLINHAGDPPRVALEDTVLDVIRELDDNDRIAFITRTLQEQRTTPLRLLARLAVRRRYPGRDLVEALLRDAAGIESVLEHAYREHVERAHQLPPMQRQYVVPGSGHRADGAYPERRLLIELDGPAFHDPEKDRALDLLHLSLGWSTTRLGWPESRLRPCATAETVASLIGAARHPCPACPTPTPTPSAASAAER